MRIDAGNYQASIQRPQSSTVASNSSALFSAILTDATANADAGTGRAAQPDFTSMTRNEMSDWMNGKIRSGEMSLDDSSAFLGMTIMIPVGTGQDAPVALDDRKQVNFVQMTRDGIAGALSRNDDTTRKMLETAMQIMQHDHGGRVDHRA